MHVWIIGAGSLGLMFGAMSASQGVRVTFGTRREQQSARLQERGVTMLDPPAAQNFPVSAFHLPNNDTQQPDLVLVTVKQTQLASLLPWLKEHIPQQTPLLFMMNGLGHTERIQAELEGRPLYVGVTGLGSTRTSDVEVELRGTGQTWIGRIDYTDQTLPHSPPRPEEQHRHRNQQLLPALQKWISLLRRGGLQAAGTDQIGVLLWEKCVVNCCINPLTALFEVPNGELIEDARLWKTMREVYEELEQLLLAIDTQSGPRGNVPVSGQAPAFGQSVLQKGKLWLNVVRVCRQTARNHSSMWQDIQYGRVTEIDAMNGYMLYIGQRVNVDMPINRFLHRAIRYKQSRPHKESRNGRS
jgi:2-dehydropantoate 2-reductase